MDKDKINEFVNAANNVDTSNFDAALLVFVTVTAAHQLASASKTPPTQQQIDALLEPAKDAALIAIRAIGPPGSMVRSAWIDLLSEMDKNWYATQMMMDRL